MQFEFYGGGMGYGYGCRDDDNRSNSARSMIIVIVVAMLTWLISFLVIRPSDVTEKRSRIRQDKP